MVVLATAAVPQPDIQEMAQKMGVAYDEHGWLSEAHPKLRPVETNTAGVYLAGACQGPEGHSRDRGAGHPRSQPRC